MAFGKPTTQGFKVVCIGHLLALLISSLSLLFLKEISCIFSELSETANHEIDTLHNVALLILFFSAARGNRSFPCNHSPWPFSQIYFNSNCSVSERKSGLESKRQEESQGNIEVRQEFRQ